MRVNKFIASHTDLSRRKVDKLISNGDVTINNRLAKIGQEITTNDKIKIKNKLLIPAATITVMLNKPEGYVCSRNGQGSKTIYDLLPHEFRQLKPIGRLDKDSSGLLLLTNDGDFTYRLTHPSFKKEKKYIVTVAPKLTKTIKQKIEVGVKLEDGISKFKIDTFKNGWLITMYEGRNRQIRRTFEAVGLSVTKLHRIKFDNFKLNNLKSGNFTKIIE